MFTKLSDESILVLSLMSDDEIEELARVAWIDLRVAERYQSTHCIGDGQTTMREAMRAIDNVNEARARAYAVANEREARIASRKNAVAIAIDVDDVFEVQTVDGVFTL